MPIFAQKKEKKEPEVPEKIPEVPTAEELKEISRKLREWVSKLKGESIKIEKKPEAPVEELKEIVKKIEEEPKVEEKPKEVKEEMPPERIIGPPLFIKLERYHKILRYISELRRTLFMTKSTISTLAEIEKLREDNLKLLRKTIESIDSRLADLDKELLRPKELPEEYPEVAAEARGVESVIGNLKDQLKSLKEELESIS